MSTATASQQRAARPDRRLAACLALRELARNAPTSFYSKTQSSDLRGSGNALLESVFPVLRGPQPIVQACGAEALSECLHIVVERRRPGTTGTLCQVHQRTMEGLGEAGTPLPSTSATAAAEKSTTSEKKRDLRVAE